NPYLCALREKTGQTVKLGVLTNSEVVLVERLGVRGESSPAAIGARLPAHCTALGRVLMAYEPRDEVALNLRKPLEPRTPRTATDPELIMDELRHTRVNGFA